MRDQKEIDEYWQNECDQLQKKYWTRKTNGGLLGTGAQNG
jgi:hypothetical protein